MMLEVIYCQKISGTASGPPYSIGYNLWPRPSSPETSKLKTQIITLNIDKLKYIIELWQHID